MESDSFDFPIRKIIHVDMDAYFASVEQLDNPELQGKPVAVGGSKERGVVAAASYEARKFGVRSAMPSAIAARRCPDIIFVKPRFDRYKELSDRIRAIFYDYTDLVEPLSLDEAFLDVTENKIGHPSATLLAQEIRYRIRHEVGLNASAGISTNKFMAKIASDVNKPNGQRTIPPEEVLDYLESLAIEQFFGIGKATADKMKFHGIFNGKDLKAKSLEYLQQYFGKSGGHFYNIVRGIQNSEVKPNRERKSIAAERTFNRDYREEDSLKERLEAIAEELEKRMSKSDYKGKTVTLKIKYADFTVSTRSKTGSKSVCTKDEILPIVFDLFDQDPLENSVRLLGISISKLDTGEELTEIQEQLRMDF